MHGILLSGLSAINSALGASLIATVRTQFNLSVRLRSGATTITLRTKGERGDQCNFTNDRPSDLELVVNEDCRRRRRAFEGTDRGCAGFFWQPPLVRWLSLFRRVDLF